MNYETIEKVYTFLYEQDKIREDWVSKIPSEINVVFCDNTYVDSLYKVNELLLDQLLINDQYLLGDINYFLYECGDGGKIITPAGVEYIFDKTNMLSGVLSYIKEVYFSE